MAAKKRKKPTRDQLFNPRIIRSRIDLRRHHTHPGEETKQFAVRTGISVDSLYKKVPGKSPYQLEDIVKIGNADEEAPLLWPLLDWDLAKDIEEEFFESPPRPKDKKP